MNTINSDKNMQIIFIAGGLATRLQPIAETIPKCMVDIAGKPLIQHQIDHFKQLGFTDYIFCLGHLANKVIEYFGDGSKFGVSIKYSIESEQLGTAGAVKLAKELIKDKFCVYYADTLSKTDLRETLKQHISTKSDATILVHKRSERSSSKNEINLDGTTITKFVEKSLTPNEWIFSGIFIAEKDILNLIPENKKYDFGKEVFPDMITKSKKLSAFQHSDFLREIGNVEKYTQTNKELANSATANKAVFLDRDGTINESCYRPEKDISDPYSINDFKISKNAKEGIKSLKEQGYKIIVVSNQPGVALGTYTQQTLDEITAHMRKEIPEIEAVYYCMHHPKTEDCDCRKPKDGLLKQAAKELNINLTESFMIGDRIIDVKAGKDCKATFLIAPLREDLLNIMEREEGVADFLVKDILEAANKIKTLKNFKKEPKTVTKRNFQIIAESIWVDSNTIESNMQKLFRKLKD